MYIVQFVKTPTK